MSEGEIMSYKRFSKRWWLKVLLTWLIALLLMIVVLGDQLGGVDMAAWLTISGVMLLGSIWTYIVFPGGSVRIDKL